MRAMVLDAPRQPLRLRQLDRPTPGPGQLLIQIHACGVCRTDLHVVDGELPETKLPIIPGHEIVGTVVAAGNGATRFPEGVRPGDLEAQAFARRLGASWAGGSDEAPPEPLDAAIIFAPAGELVPTALRAVRPGGTVVCAGIHMSDIPSFPYDILRGERVVRSVANLTRRDGEEFLALAPTIPIRTTVETFPLEAANEALARLRDGRIEGAAVLIPGRSPAG